MTNEQTGLSVNKMRLYMLSSLKILVLVYLLWLTVLPVEVRWADADVYLNIGIPVIGIAGMICILLSKAQMKVSIVDGMVMIWALYYVGRVWIGAEYPCGIDFLKAMEMVLLYFTLRCVLNNARWSGWWLIAGIVGCGIYESLLGIYQILTGTSRHHLFLFTGSFQNPGPYSAYLMMAAIMGLSVCSLYLKDIKREIRKISNKVRGSIPEGLPLFFRIIVFVPILVLPATWSRSAFVGFGLCALWSYRKKYWKYRYYVWSCLAALAVVFYFIKRGSADGRTLIWMASLTSWLHDIWFGVGVGGFRNACAEGIAEMWNAKPQSIMFESAGVTDCSYNALLNVLVEQGLIGAILCVATVVLAMVRLFKQSVILFLGMTSLVIFSMFSYPFELLPYTIIAVMVIAWSESENKESLSIHISKMKCSVVCLIAIAFSCCLKEEISDRIEQDEEANLFSGMQNEAFLPDYYELLPYENDDPHYLFDFAKTLRSAKRYGDSNAILRQATLVSPDPMFYVLMGNNYKDQKYYDLSEKAYKKAFSIMPNRLYPLYQLMLLYAETGEIQKSRKMAQRIVAFKEKVTSPATKEMKDKARDVLNQNR